MCLKIRNTQKYKVAWVSQSIPTLKFVKAIFIFAFLSQLTKRDVIYVKP